MIYRVFSLSFVLFFQRPFLPPTEDVDKSTGNKILTEYKYNDDDKKVKVVRTYKVETRKVSKSIAERKASSSNRGSYSHGYRTD
jgi:hypothetical protein